MSEIEYSDLGKLRSTIRIFIASFYKKLALLKEASPNAIFATRIPCKWAVKWLGKVCLENGMTCIVRVLGNLSGGIE